MSPYAEWFKCFGDRWCDLLEINLEHSLFDGIKGIYIIWFGGRKPTILKVGKGVIRERLSEHREDYILASYSQYGLYTTWAEVVDKDCDGVAKYLEETLKPLMGTRMHEVPSIKVNLPWEGSFIHEKKEIA